MAGISSGKPCDKQSYYVLVQLYMVAIDMAIDDRVCLVRLRFGRLLHGMYDVVAIACVRVVL